MRAKKALNNTLFGLIYEFAAIICGFIVPRLILESFGSDYNGMISAITQFLAAFSLFQAGIGGVTMAALYRPLAENDRERISEIMKTTEKFMRNIAMLFVVFLLILSFVYPFFVSEQFDYFFTLTLVLIIGISTFSQYFFGLTYSFLISADQRRGFISIVNTVKIIANTVVVVAMIKLGFGIRAVKACSTLVYVIAPIFIRFYIKKKYQLDTDAKPDMSLLKQRWDNFGQQVANFVVNNTDLIILSIFSTVYEISVYSVYYMVVNAVHNLFTPLVNGVSAAFGNMIAKGELDLLKKNLRTLEQVVFSSATFLFSVSSVMIVSFVNIYTKGITDVNYNRPVFAYLIVSAVFVKCLRFSYIPIVTAAGHFKQTRNPAFIEAAINIILSVILVFNFGLVGVVIGTLVAFIYRVVRYAVYVSRVLVKRSLFIFIQRVVLSILLIIVVNMLTALLPFKIPDGYLSWTLNAIIISIMGLVIVVTAEILFYRDDLVRLLHMLRGIVKR